jgi:hypothetical protein
VTASAYTTYRAALMATLNAAMPLYSWVAGAPPNNSSVPDADPSGYVWIAHVEPLQSNKYVEQITCGVRAYVIFGERVDASTPIDPSQLEQAAEDIQTALAPVQAPGDPWFYEITAMDFDNEIGYVEATVVGSRWNDFSLGG